MSKKQESRQALGTYLPGTIGAEGGHIEEKSRHLEPIVSYGQVRGYSLPLRRRLLLGVRAEQEESSKPLWRSPLSGSHTRWRGRGEADPLTRSQYFVSHWTRRDGDLLVGEQSSGNRGTRSDERGSHMQSFSDNVVRVQSVPFFYSIHPLPIHWLSSP